MYADFIQKLSLRFCQVTDKDRLLNFFFFSFIRSHVLYRAIVSRFIQKYTEVYFVRFTPRKVFLGVYYYYMYFCWEVAYRFGGRGLPI